MICLNLWPLPSLARAIWIWSKFNAFHFPDFINFRNLALFHFFLFFFFGISRSSGLNVLGGKLLCTSVNVSGDVIDVSMSLTCSWSSSNISRKKSFLSLLRATEDVYLHTKAFSRRKKARNSCLCAPPYRLFFALISLAIDGRFVMNG